jgi:hypothetical protein
MRRFVFCNRCRGMRVGWNARYGLHCLTCTRLLSQASKMMILTMLIVILILGSPMPSVTVFSGDTHPTLRPEGLGSSPAEALVIPAVHSMEVFLGQYSVDESHRIRVAESIVTTARKYNLDAKLIGSIVIVESRANPFAISDKDSVGMMQIHLPTWGQTAVREGINLFKIEDNVDFGARILKDYVRQFGLWEGVKRYKGWIPDDPASQQSAEDYVAKVQRVYGVQQPSLASASLLQ